MNTKWLSSSSILTTEAMLLLVIVSLIVITALIGAMVRHMTLSHRQIKQWRTHAQSRWLVESGIERGVARLKQDANYTGELWHLTADELQIGADAEAEVDIQVLESDGRLMLEVAARYPLNSEFFSRVRKSVPVTLPVSETALEKKETIDAEERLDVE